MSDKTLIWIAVAVAVVLVLRARRRPALALVPPIEPERVDRVPPLADGRPAYCQWPSFAPRPECDVFSDRTARK